MENAQVKGNHGTGVNPKRPGSSQEQASGIAECEGSTDRVLLARVRCDLRGIRG